MQGAHWQHRATILLWRLASRGFRPAHSTHAKASPNAILSQSASCEPHRAADDGHLKVASSIELPRPCRRARGSQWRAANGCCPARRPFLAGRCAACAGAVQLFHDSEAPLEMHYLASSCLGLRLRCVQAPPTLTIAFFALPLFSLSLHVCRALTRCTSRRGEQQRLKPYVLQVSG